jgi:hypothetical protein
MGSGRARAVHVDGRHHVTPDRAKLLDVGTTVPKVVQDLVTVYGDPR